MTPLPRTKRTRGGFVVDAAPGILVGLAAALFLFAFVAVDPAPGVTASASPFTDEAWHVLNARNVILFGTWSTDQYTLHLITLPFSAAVAGVFGLLGVGIVQARSVDIVATGLTVTLLAMGLRSVVGRGPALLAAIAFGASALVLYYGRLAFLEPVESFFLVMAFLLAVRDGRHRPIVIGFLAGVALALAIGTKASAIFPAAGIILGAIAVGFRDRDRRLWSVGSLAGLGAGGFVWLALIGLPNLSALSPVVATLPAETLPQSIGALVSRVAAYMVRSDGAWTLAFPIIVGGVIGAVVSAIRWARLTAEERRALVIAIAWLIGGLGILFVLPYRPNRYVEPMLPALAVLTALAGRAAVDSSRWTAARPSVRRAIGVLVVIAVMAQGAALNIRWLTSTPSDLPAIQARVQALVPAGAVIQGAYAPLLAMTTRSTTIVAWPGGKVNGGDLYAQRGVRWVVGVPGSPGDIPTWVPLHRAAWDARREVLCITWGGERVCMWALT